MKIDKKKYPLLVVVVGQKCNLKCSHCSNFTSLMPQIHYDYKKQIDDLTLISKVAHFDTFQIQGGEIFQWDLLPNFILEVRNLNFVNKIQIATNGAVQLSDQLNEVLKNDPNIIVRISPYPQVTDKLGKRLARQLESNKINFYLHNFGNRNDNWADLGGPFFEELDNKVGENNYQSCAFKGCLTLEDGILARCSRGPTAHQVQNFTPYKDDLFKVRKIHKLNFFKNLIRYLDNPQPMRACNFCNGTNGKIIQAGAQYKKKEWENILLKIKSQKKENIFTKKLSRWLRIL